MKKKTIVIDNEVQEKILKDALDMQKFSRQLGLKSREPKDKEEKINEIYQIEKLEKQLK